MEAGAPEHRVVVVPATDGHMNLIRDSWLESYVRGRCGPMKRVPPGPAFKGHRPVMEALLARGVVLVAALESEPDAVFGWVCAEAGGTLHFVYVRHKYRGLGYARALIAAAEQRVGKVQRVTHETHAWRRFVERHGALPWSPGHAFYPPEPRERAA